MTEASAPPLDPDQPGFVPPVAPGQEAPQGSYQAEQEQQDYFSFSRSEQWYLPDGKSYMTVTVLDEGKKKDFQKKTQRDVTLARGSGDAKFSLDQAEERHQLIIASVTDWNLKRNGDFIPLSTNAQNNKKNLRDWLELTNPELVESLEKFIRKLNPWLIGEVTVADLDKQIEELKEQRDDLAKREAGEGSSSSK